VIAFAETKMETMARAFWHQPPEVRECLKMLKQILKPFQPVRMSELIRLCVDAGYSQEVAKQSLECMLQMNALEEIED
jgi:hypothetical protein